MSKSWSVLAAGMIAWPVLGAPVRSGPVEAELVPEVENIAPGQPFTVALRLKMDPPWHTYWINPGDSGLAPRLDWSLPEGFSADELLFPPPAAIPTPPFMTYGFGNEVWLLSTITPPAVLKSDRVVLKAVVSWLICNEVCVPGSASLVLRLPVQAGGAKPHPVHAAQISAARARLPEPAAGWQFRVRHENGLYHLAVFPPPGYAGEIQSASFFPFQNDIIQHSAPQKWRRSAEGYTLELVPADPAASPESLSGVLVIDERDSRRALRAEAVFPRTETPRDLNKERNTP